MGLLIFFFFFFTELRTFGPLRHLVNWLKYLNESFFSSCDQKLIFWISFFKGCQQIIDGFGLGSLSIGPIYQYIFSQLEIVGRAWK